MVLSKSRLDRVLQVDGLKCRTASTVLAGVQEVYARVMTEIGKTRDLEKGEGRDLNGGSGEEMWLEGLPNL